MFFRNVEKQSNDSFQQTLRLKDEIENADAIVIGAGAGLSTSAGFTYSGERFRRYFSDFADKYSFKDMYSGGFYPYETLEEHWAYWSRYIYVNRYVDAPKSVYNDLLEIIRDKDYFVITTNVDHCFQKAGFDKHRLFYTQGDYGLFQCSRACHNKTYDNEEIIYQMMDQQEDMRIPTALIPYCPVCGAPMSMNLRADETFVEDKGWHKASERYHEFLRRYKGLHILFLELGVGYNTPGIVKYPFWQMTAGNRKAVYASINYGDNAAPREIESQSICIHGDIGVILEEIK